MCRFRIGRTSGRMLTSAMFAVIVMAAAAAFAQGADTAYVPFRVNIGATITATPQSGAVVTKTVSANAADTLKLPIVGASVL